MPIIEVTIKIKNSAGECIEETFPEWSDAYDFAQALWEVDRERLEKGGKNEHKNAE